MSKITKLGMGIVSFEGNEHLKNITYEIREYVDEIVVCLQKTSYHGDAIKQSDVDEVEHLKDMGYIDDIIWFEPVDKHEDKKESAPRYVETDKRNFILDYLEKECGCSHCLITDSDEFYDGADFKKAKDLISKSENVHVSYCQYVNYYRDYQHVMVWPFESYVPFITESSYRFLFEKGNFNRPSDPTRRYEIPGEKKEVCVLPWKLIKMHHLSWIRLNIEDKMNAWSSKKLFQNYELLKKGMLNRYYNFRDGMNAIIMFNVPGYSVIVNKLPKQYIHPKFFLSENIETPYEYRGVNNGD